MFRFTMTSIIGFAVAATAALAIVAAFGAASASADSGRLFTSISGNTGGKKSMVNTVTAQGVRNTLIVNANVGDAADTPFWARLCRVSGDSTKYLVGALAYSFDHTQKKWYAKYTVDDGNVVYSVFARHPKTGATGTTGSTGATGSTGPTGATGVSSEGTDASSNKLVDVATNLQFVDPDHQMVRIGKLRKGECVTIAGRVSVPDRIKVGFESAMFFRLVLGVTQLNPDDAGYPQPEYGRMTASLYGAALPKK